ncbi:MAG: hypothetical protein LZF86_110323 [Nitrospira sp.]|nr:MAG: hypothetical protein LZF86_110323 [Nitrospira sp.]
MAAMVRIQTHAERVMGDLVAHERFGIVMLSLNLFVALVYIEKSLIAKQ